MITIDGSAFDSEIVPFAEEGDVTSLTRVNLAGDQFVDKDLIRLRVICPFVNSAEYGESTWGSSYDDWRLYTWGGAQKQWGSVGSGRGFDVDGDFKASNAPGDIIMPQATPYVFTATTWTEEIHHIISNPGSTGGTIVVTFSNIFKADQRNDKDYRDSDVLWAQQFMQSGTDHVRLSFQHKMAALRIDVSAFASASVLDNTDGAEEIILTLENMPDIDRQEVTIGNYYAEKMANKDKKRAYGDYWRTRCDKEDNGKVLGIVVPDQKTAGHLIQVPFTELPQTGIYTGHREGNVFSFIIPPYIPSGEKKPKLWLRQGENRWSANLTIPTGGFESGKRYTMKMTMPTVVPAP